MKPSQLLTFATVIAAATTSHAQYVKGNEAVTTLPNGGKHVELAPLPSTGIARSVKPCKADAGCNAGPWIMVETIDGLLECTEVYARAGTCRASTYSTQKLSRLWVVKSHGKWLQCQYPTLGSKCVDVFARPPANLPYDAVQ